MWYIVELIIRIPALRTLILTVGPAVFLIWRIAKRDRIEKEPTKLVIALVALGGTVSVALALGLEKAGTLLIAPAAENAAYPFLENFVVVALSEEFAKFLPVFILTWHNRNFNCTFDGIVYAAAGAAGFALIENIIYVIHFGAGAALLRAVFSVPSHICDGVVMGIWYSAAKRHSRRGAKRASRLCLAAAVISPALLHGAYDLIASQEDALWLGALLVFVVAQYIACAVLIGRHAKNDAYIDGTAAVLCLRCGAVNPSSTRWCWACSAILPAYEREAYEIMRAFARENGVPETRDAIETLIIRLGLSAPDDDEQNEKTAQTVLTEALSRGNLTSLWRKALSDCGYPEQTASAPNTTSTRSEL